MPADWPNGNVFQLLLIIHPMGHVDCKRQINKIDNKFKMLKN